MSFDEKAYSKAYSKARAEKLRAAGLCVRCGLVRDGDGKSLCVACKEKARQHAKQVRSERMATHRCVQCQAATQGQRLCESCRAAYKAGCEQRKASDLEAGICLKCREKSANDGVQFCAACLRELRASAKAQRRKKVANGLCCTSGCPNACDGTVQCTTCRKALLKAQSERRKQRILDGFCRNCGAQATIAQRRFRGIDRKTYCDRCYLKVLANGALGATTHWKVLMEKLDANGWKCTYTGKALVLGDNLSFDHANPVSRFPEQKRDPDNIVPVDWQVNLAKRDLTQAEFVALARAVVAHADSQRGNGESVV